jgi:hypothetical protein
MPKIHPQKKRSYNDADRHGSHQAEKSPDHTYTHHRMKTFIPITFPSNYSL